MHSYDNTCCIKHDVKQSSSSSEKTNWQSQHVQNVRHKLASVLAIGQLYCQSATAPGCITQLRDVIGLSLPVRRSSKPVSCTFLNTFLFLFVSCSCTFLNTFLFLFVSCSCTFLNTFLVLFVSCSYQEILESVAKHRSVFIPISFKSKLFSSVSFWNIYQLFTKVYMTVTSCLRHE